MAKALKRLKERMLISVDYDGTICEHAFPEVGTPMEGAIETLKDLTAAGHLLILSTCREDEKRRAYLTEAVDFMKQHGVEFVSVNQNRPEDEFREKPGRKIYADVYIDDRNFGGFPGWAAVREAFGLKPLAKSSESPQPSREVSQG